MLKNLEELVKTIRDRKNNPKENSYTNQLLADKKLSISKVKEEINELKERALEEQKKQQSLSSENQPALQQPIIDQNISSEPQEPKVPQTIQRNAPKLGRNDPCHCGSGKKFKHCCGK